MRLVVDACVSAAEQCESEANSAAAVEFLQQCLTDEITIFAPAIVLAEVAASVARKKNDYALGEIAPTKILRGYRIAIRNVDETFAPRAGRLAARFSLRGADSLYVALARELRATLITDDGVMLTNGCAAVDCITPAEWLRRRAARRA